MTLRVTFEIVPFGVEANKRTIHTLNIHNIGTDALGWTEYSFDLNGVASTETIVHQRSEGALELARKVLDTEFIEDYETPFAGSLPKVNVVHE